MSPELKDHHSYRSPSVGFLALILLATLLLTGCVITASPQQGFSWGVDPQFEGTVPPFTPMPEPPSPESTTPAGDTTVTVDTTFHWAILGLNERFTPVTVEFDVDYLIPGRVFDGDYFDPDDANSTFIEYLKQQDLAIDDLTLEYAVIYNSEDETLNRDWSLYARVAPEMTFTETHVFASSSIAQGVPYTITETIVFGKAAADGNDECATDASMGIECLRQSVGSTGLSILKRPTAFLIFSYMEGDTQRYVMSWFLIAPNGQNPGAPGATESVCGYCQNVCDGRGWCRWVCPLCSRWD